MQVCLHLARSITRLLSKCDNQQMVFPFALIGFGILGWIASFGLTLERIKVAGDPSAATACDISPFISCKSVMLSEQAALLGFPNPLIGLTAFFAPVVVGMAILAGAKFASWFWQLFLLGHVFAIGFVIWLFTQSVYDIGSLCLYCMVAWTAAIPLFWAVFGFSAKAGHLGPQLRPIGDFVFSWSWVLTVLSYLALAVPVLIHFWRFWPTLL